MTPYPDHDSEPEDIRWCHRYERKPELPTENCDLCGLAKECFDPYRNTPKLYICPHR